MRRNGFDYRNGTILDPRNGFKFYGRMRLSPDGQTLTVRGYLGIEPLGGNDVWRRLPDGAYNELDPTVTAGHALRDAGRAHPPELTACQSQSRSLRIVNATGVAPSPRRSSYPTIA